LAHLRTFGKEPKGVFMLSHRSLPVLLVLGCVLGWALPAHAHVLTGATATANCQGYSLSVNATDLTVGTAYTIDYSFTVKCTSSSGTTSSTVTGSIAFKATATTQTEKASGSFPSATFPGGESCDVTGKATLTSSGSTVEMNINSAGVGASAPLSCPSFVCTIGPSGTAIPGAPVSWNSFSASAPDVVWINAHIGTPSGVPTTSVTTVEFTGVTFTVNSTSYALPNGTLRFDPSAPATPSTTFSSATGWTTTVNPSYLSDEIFFDGQAVPVDSNITGGGQATLSFTTRSTDNNLDFQWQWSAAVYTYWPGNNAADILAYHDSLHAGTPQNTEVQQSLIQGPRGGGGSNYTGSWSGTGQGACPGAQ
jgi:hypothetical protein